MRPVLPLGCTFCASDELASSVLDTRLYILLVVTRVIIGHQVAAIARRNLLRPAGRLVKQDNGLIRLPRGLHPYPGLAGHLSTRFFHHLHPRFVTVDDTIFQQLIPPQVEQGLQMFAALDRPAR
jgi:hypothetical protein